MKPDSTLIEKLEARVSHAANPSMQTLGRNQAFVEAIAIIRQHQTEQPQDAVERVAKSLWATVNARAVRINVAFSIKSWDELPAFVKSEFYEDAKAAIAAMVDGSVTIAPVSAEIVQPITPAREYVFGYNETNTTVPYPTMGDASNRKTEATCKERLQVQRGEISDTAVISLEIYNSLADSAERLSSWDDLDDAAFTEAAERVQRLRGLDRPFKPVAQGEVSDSKPLSRDEANRICHIDIRKNEDGSYLYSHSGCLPFGDIFACLKRQGWDPEPVSVSLTDCAKAAHRAKYGVAVFTDEDMGVAKAVLDAAGVKHE